MHVEIGLDCVGLDWSRVGVVWEGGEGFVSAFGVCFFVGWEVFVVLRDFVWVGGFCEDECGVVGR